jgi:hypothetical protein
MSFLESTALPMYRSSFSVPSLTSNRTLFFPDVSGTVITTGNSDILFGAGEGRDLTAASISDMLTVKGNTLLGDDANDEIRFGGSIAQKKLEITPSSVMRNGSMFVRHHGLAEGDFFVVAGVTDQANLVRHLLNGVLFYCKTIINEHHFQAGYPTKTLDVIIGSDALGGQISIIAGNVMKRISSVADVGTLASKFAKQDVLTVLCGSVGNSSLGVKVPHVRVALDGRITPMAGESMPSASSTCVGTKVLGAATGGYKVVNYSAFNVFNVLFHKADFGDGDVIRVLVLQNPGSDVDDSTYHLPSVSEPFLDNVFSVSVSDDYTEAEIKCASKVKTPSAWLPSEEISVNNFVALKVNDPEFLPLTGVTLTRQTNISPVIGGHATLPHNLKTEDVVHVSRESCDSNLGLDDFIYAVRKINETHFELKNCSSDIPIGELGTDYNVARLNGHAPTMPFTMQSGRVELLRRAQRPEDRGASSSDLLKHTLADGDAVLLSGIGHVKYTHHNGKVVTVASLSTSNHSFVLEGVEPFPNGLYFLLTKLTNETRKMRTGITNANPAVVSLNFHGFKTGDVISIGTMGGMDELEKKRLVVSNSNSDRDQFALRWDVPSRMIYAKKLGETILKAQFSSTVEGDMSPNLLVSDSIRVTSGHPDAVAYSSMHPVCVHSIANRSRFELCHCITKQLLNSTVLGPMDTVLVMEYATKLNIVSNLTQHTDSVDEATNIRISTKYEHGFHNGDTVEVSGLQRSETVNFFPFRVFKISMFEIELVDTGGIVLESFPNPPSGNIELLERDVDSTSFLPYTVAAQAAAVVNITTSNPAQVEIAGVDHTFLGIGMQVTFSGVSGLPGITGASFTVSNFTVRGGNIVIILAGTDTSQSTISYSASPFVLENVNAGIVSRGDVMSFSAKTGSSNSMSFSLVDPTSHQRLLVPDSSGTLLTSGNLKDMKAANGAVHSMKIEHSFSVGGDVHLAAQGGSSTAFIGGSLEVDGVSMFRKSVDLFSTETQSITHRGTPGAPAKGLHVSSTHGEVKVEDIVVRGRDMSGLSTLTIAVAETGGTAFKVTAKAGIGTEDIVRVQNNEETLSYFKVDSNGTVRIGEGLQEVPVPVTAAGTNVENAPQIKRGASLVSVKVVSMSGGVKLPDPDEGMVIKFIRSTNRPAAGSGVTTTVAPGTTTGTPGTTTGAPAIADMLFTFFIYPSGDASINGESAGTPLAVLNTTKLVTCVAYDTSNWICTKQHASGGGSEGGLLESTIIGKVSPDLGRFTNVEIVGGDAGALDTGLTVLTGTEMRGSLSVGSESDATPSLNVNSEGIVWIGEEGLQQRPQQIFAAGTNESTAARISAGASLVNVLTATENGGVRLPQPTPGMAINILRGRSNSTNSTELQYTFLIYPQGNTSINGQVEGEILPVPISTKIVGCIAFDATSWICTKQHAKGGGSEGGRLESTAVGMTSPAEGRFTTLNVDTGLSINGLSALEATPTSTDPVLRVTGRGTNVDDDILVVQRRSGGGNLTVSGSGVVRMTQLAAEAGDISGEMGVGVLNVHNTLHARRFEIGQHEASAMKLSTAGKLRVVSVVAPNAPSGLQHVTVPQHGFSIGDVIVVTDVVPPHSELNNNMHVIVDVLSADIVGIQLDDVLYESGGIISKVSHGNMAPITQTAITRTVPPLVHHVGFENNDAYASSGDLLLFSDIPGGIGEFLAGKQFLVGAEVGSHYFSLHMSDNTPAVLPGDNVVVSGQVGRVSTLDSGLVEALHNNGTVRMQHAHGFNVGDQVVFGGVVLQHENLNGSTFLIQSVSSERVFTLADFGNGSTSTNPIAVSGRVTRVHNGSAWKVASASQANKGVDIDVHFLNAGQVVLGRGDIVVLGGVHASISGHPYIVQDVPKINITFDSLVQNYTVGDAVTFIYSPGNGANCTGTVGAIYGHTMLLNDAVGTFSPAHQVDVKHTGAVLTARATVSLLGASEVPGGLLHGALLYKVNNASTGILSPRGLFSKGGMGTFVSSFNHSFSDGDRVLFYNISGMTPLNYRMSVGGGANETNGNVYVVKVEGNDMFSISRDGVSPLDSSSFDKNLGFGSVCKLAGLEVFYLQNASDAVTMRTMGEHSLTIGDEVIFFGVSQAVNQERFTVNGTTPLSFSIDQAAFTRGSSAFVGQSGILVRVRTNVIRVDSTGQAERFVVSKDLTLDGGTVSLASASAGTIFRLKQGERQSATFAIDGHPPMMVFDTRDGAEIISMPRVNVTGLTVAALNVVSLTSSDGGLHIDGNTGSLHVNGTITMRGNVDLSQSKVSSMRIQGTLNVDASADVHGVMQTSDIRLGSLASLNTSAMSRKVSIGGTRKDRLFAQASVQNRRVLSHGIRKLSKSSNWTVYAEAHGFTNNELVVCSGIPNVPNIHNHIFLVVNAAQDRFDLAHTEAVNATDSDPVMSPTVTALRQAQVAIVSSIGIDGSTMTLTTRASHVFVEGDPVVVNGSIRTILPWPKPTKTSFSINGTGAHLSTGCSMQQIVQQACVVTKLLGIKATLDQPFYSAVATVEAKVTLPTETFIYDFRKGDLLIVSSHDGPGTLLKISSEPINEKNMTFEVYSAGEAVGSASVPGHITRVAQRSKTIISVSNTNPVVVTFDVQGTYDTHGFSRGDVIMLVDVRGTVAYRNRFCMVGSTNRTTLELSGVDGTLFGAGTQGFAASVSEVSTSMSFEGATVDDFQTSFRFIDPSRDNAIVFPDVSGTVITSGNLIDMTSNLRDLKILSMEVSGATRLLDKVSLSDDFAINEDRFTVEATTGNMVVSGSAVVHNRATLNGNLTLGQDADILATAAPREVFVKTDVERAWAFVDGGIAVESLVDDGAHVVLGTTGDHSIQNGGAILVTDLLGATELNEQLFAVSRSSDTDVQLRHAADIGSISPYKAGGTVVKVTTDHIKFVQRVGVSRTLPPLVQLDRHGFRPGDVVSFEDIPGPMSLALNGEEFLVHDIDTVDMFSIKYLNGTDVDGTVLGEYVDAGTSRVGQLTRLHRNRTGRVVNITDQGVFTLETSHSFHVGDIIVVGNVRSSSGTTNVNGRVFLVDGVPNSRQFNIDFASREIDFQGYEDGGVVSILTDEEFGIETTKGDNLIDS